MPRPYAVLLAALLTACQSGSGDLPAVGDPDGRRTEAKTSSSDPSPRLASASESEPKPPEPDSGPREDEASPPVPQAPLIPRLVEVPRLRIETRLPRRPAPLVELARQFRLAATPALRRAQILTGLTFRPGPPLGVELVLLQDEEIPYELGAEVQEGCHRTVLRVNAEPILAGRVELERALAAALAAMLLQDATWRYGGTAEWVREVAARAAAGDLDRVLQRLMLRWTTGDLTALRVVPEEPDQSQQTGAAALLLLAERRGPAGIRRFLALVADGEDPSEVLGRVVGLRGGGWLAPARLLLAERVRQSTTPAVERLAAAEAALEETGRAGLESVVTGAIPPEIAAEVALLRARAALDEGDGAGARSYLRSVGPEDASALRDPAEALLLRIEAERAPGGDAALASALLARLVLEYPKRARAAAPPPAETLFVLEEDPQRWMRLMRRRIAETGSAALDLLTAERLCRLLLLDHRSGAAEALLLTLGDRGHAPELHQVAAAVAAAQRDPTPAALARARARILALAASTRSGEAEEGVTDSGMAAAQVLVRHSLPPESERAGPSRLTRRDLLRLLLRTAGETRAPLLLVQLWTRYPAVLAQDLEDLAGLMSTTGLRSLVFSLPEDLPRRAGSTREALWSTLVFDLSPRWLRRHPSFPQRVRDRVYAVRRNAWDTLWREGRGEETPALLQRALRDASPLIRARGVELAGRARIAPLVTGALGDERAIVRGAAVRALAQLPFPQRRELLEKGIRVERDPEVRTLAIEALLGLKQGLRMELLERLLLDLASFGEGHRERIEAALLGVDRSTLALALARVLEREAAQPAPDRARVAQIGLFFQRLSGVDAGIHPSLTAEALGAVAARMREWARQPQSTGAVRLPAR